jgi:ATP-dependent exoDNAse (exonuclease V) beta subunit
VTQLADQKARDLIRTGLESTLVVEAAAGTGKTTELVNRVISILAEGPTTVERIVAVTFTDKAAGELKLRLRTGLEEARTQAGNDTHRRSNIEQAIAHLEEARAGTIHSFCADLLRERPLEAQVDPQFEPMDEGAAEQLYGEVFRLWLQRTLEKPPEGIRRSLRRRAMDDSPLDRLQRAAWTLVTWRDFPAPWRRAPFERIAAINKLVDQLHEFAELTRRAAKHDHPVYLGSWRARQVSDHIRASERTHPRDYDGLEAEFVFLSRQGDFCKFDRKGTLNYGTGVTREDVLAKHEVLVAAVKQFAQNADADLAALLHTELRASLGAYEDLKARTGRLDFLDLLLRARDLVRDNFAVRKDLQQRFTHIFVDEFQDTDPLQAEILLLLAAADAAVSDWRQVTPVPGKLFIVGDPKQAIYRFRRADVGLYNQVRDLLVERGAVKVDLSTSFRSVPSIQNLVNTAFAPQMTGDLATLQAAYVPLSPHRVDDADQPSIVALSVPQPYGKKKLSGEAVLKSQPDALGAFLEWLLKQSGWRISERGRTERVPIAARHICIMFRRFEKYGDDMTKAYVDALEARGIPHLLVGGKSFHEREEVETLRSALAAIEWPDDELSVYATLHGSLFAIADDVMLEYRRQFHKLHPFRIPEKVPESLEPVTGALDLLQSLCRQRNYRPVAETVNVLLNTTRAHAGFAMRPSGEQVLANVMRVAELAREYESSGGTSFRGFVEQLLGDAERGKQAEAAIYEEGAEGVRLMSVHKAKGLEFPVVILADVTAKIAHTDPDRYLAAEHGLCAVKLAGWAPRELLDHAAEEHARDIAEGVRVAYVAATRARDLLVVPAIGDDPTPGTGPQMAAEWWVAPLHPAIYPPEERRRKPSLARQCPKFGIDSVVVRPDGDPADDTNVRPGAHGFGKGDQAYSVVWWDPRVLELGKTPSFSLRQEHLLKDVDETVVERDLETYTDWRAQHRATLEKGAQPSLHVQTASERARSELKLETGDVSIVEIALGARPFGPRFGSLVHVVLATIPLDGDASQIGASARLHGRILGATVEEIEAAVTTVAAALQHPLMERACKSAACGACHREVPLTLREEDGTLIEGLADLAFRENDKWIVVDFKTDQELAAALERYRRQVAIYATAISKATSTNSEAFLFRL